nr:unnamed protein product [Callosobruchus analis]
MSDSSSQSPFSDFSVRDTSEKMETYLDIEGQFSIQEYNIHIENCCAVYYDDKYYIDLVLDINRELKDEIKARPIDGIKIFQYCGGINFATRNLFRTSLYQLVELDPQKELAYRTKLAQKLQNGEDPPKQNDVHKITKLKRKVNFNLKCVILDFSAVSYIDPSGISMIKIITESFKKLDISVYVCGCSDPIYDLMEKCELIKTLKPSLRVFQSIHDAVQCSSTLFGIELESGHV